MSEVQRIFFEADDNIHELDIDLATPEIEPTFENDSPYDEQRDIQAEAIKRMREARQMMRIYAQYALSAFKDFGAAEIEEVTLKFGLKLGGKTGIPYITEGTADANLEIELKCKLPNKKSGNAT